MDLILKDELGNVVDQDKLLTVYLIIAQEIPTGLAFPLTAFVDKGNAESFIKSKPMGKDYQYVIEPLKVLDADQDALINMTISKGAQA